MKDEYKPSDHLIDDLEKSWLQSQTSELDHLQMHRCSAELLSFENLEIPKHFEVLFEHIGREVRLSSEEVKRKLCAAKEAGILNLGGYMAVDVGARLAQSLNEMHRAKGRTPVIQRVIVAPVESRFKPSKSDRAAATARSAADYFTNVVPPGPMVSETPDNTNEPPDNTNDPTSRWVGFCGGRTILRMVNRIITNPRRRYTGLIVLPLAGEADPENFPISANSIVAHLVHSRALGNIPGTSLMGFPYLGHATEEKDLDSWQKRCRKMESTRNVIDRAKRVKFAFAGIGDAQSEESSIQRLKKFCEIEEDMPENCVGDICYQPMDENGNGVWPQLSKRVVGLTLEDLKAMTKFGNRRVFAVACGKEKVKGIIAAVKGGLVNGLITDELTALEILDELDKAEPTTNSKASSKNVPEGKLKAKSKKKDRKKRGRS